MSGQVGFDLKEALAALDQLRENATLATKAMRGILAMIDRLPAADRPAAHAALDRAAAQYASLLTLISLEH